MARALWLPAALRSFGLKVELTAGWETRGVGPLAAEGVLLHHTASAPGRNAPSLNTVIKGRPDLPGPLCHILLARDGTCIVIASGIANHAGKGNWRGLTTNRQLLGIEAENDGVGEHWPAVQLDAYQRCTAALLVHLGKSAEWAAGHKEYALPKGRKIDPAGIDLDAFRRGVAQLLSPAPSPIALEDDMPTVIAVDLAIDPTNLARGYKLDAKGGIHPFGGAPKLDNPAYKDWDKAGIAPARRLCITRWGNPVGGYILDAIGGVTAVGSAPVIATEGYWPKAFIPPAPVV